MDMFCERVITTKKGYELPRLMKSHHCGIYVKFISYIFWQNR